MQRVDTGFGELRIKYIQIEFAFGKLGYQPIAPFGGEKLRGESGRNFAKSDEVGHVKGNKNGFFGTAAFFQLFCHFFYPRLFERTFNFDNGGFVVFFADFKIFVERRNEQIFAFLPVDIVYKHAAHQPERRLLDYQLVGRHSFGKFVVDYDVFAVRGAVYIALYALIRAVAGGDERRERVLFFQSAGAAVSDYFFAGKGYFFGIHLCYLL